MAKQLRTIDILVDKTEHFVYAQTLFDSDYAAIAATEKEAIEQLGRLLESLLEVDPGMGAVDTEYISRNIKVEIPAATGSRLVNLELHLFAVCEPLTSGYKVWLPQLQLRYRVESLEELEHVSAEWVRDAFPMDRRANYLQRFTHPLSTPGNERGSRIKAEKLEIRFRPNKAKNLEDELNTPTLSTVGELLNPRMLKRDAPRAYERRAEVQTVLDYLSESQERSVLLTGPQGAGKTAVTYEVAYRIAKGEAPERLQNVPIWQISGGRLLAGMRFLGQWQERVLALLEEVKEVGAILFAENLIELLETSGNDKHSQGIPGMLLPHMLSGDLVIITEARPEQIARAEQSHPGFLRALRRLSIDPLQPGACDKVLDRLSYRLGRQYGVRLTSETREQVLELVGRFKGVAALPGPAVDLAERMARTNAKPGIVDEDGERPALTPSHAIDAYASMTGLPRPLIDPKTPFQRQDVITHFDRAVFDQPEGIQAMVELVTTMRAGLNSPERPLGSFLFLGPTGVGKTQTALTLAQYLFGNKDRLIRFDMSEYQDAWSAGRLVGRYQGEQGELVRRVREQPFSVILLDEIEKAHSNVFDFLLQALGEGRLTDGIGQTVTLTSAVIIMTSNLGAGGPSSLGFGQRSSEVKRNAEVAHYTSAVENYFRPEFVGRIDKIIPFRSLSQRTARRLVEKALEEAFAREGLVRRRLQVRASDDLIEHLITIGFDEKYGARPLRQTVENLVTTPLAKFLAANVNIQNTALIMDLKDNVVAVSSV